eukprot:scaffold271_cov336-Pavlova_lutheri.AAC.46
MTSESLAWRSWLTRPPNTRKIPGSSPGANIDFVFFGRVLPLPPPDTGAEGIEVNSWRNMTVPGGPPRYGRGRSRCGPSERHKPSSELEPSRKPSDMGGFGWRHGTVGRTQETVVAPARHRCTKQAKCWGRED